MDKYLEVEWPGPVAELNKWDYIELKAFHAVEETINKRKDELLNGRRCSQVKSVIRD